MIRGSPVRGREKREGAGCVARTDEIDATRARRASLLLVPAPAAANGGMLFVALADATAFTENEVDAKPARGAVAIARVRASAAVA